MRPEIWRIPYLNLPIHGYGLMIVIGFLLAAWLASREARRRGLPDVVYDLGVVMLLSGLLGGRIFYFIQYYDKSFRGRPWYSFFAIWEGGLVFYGGAIGGSIGGLLFLYLRRLPVRELLDAVAPFVPIGMGFGRLGCFMNGCCYGERCAIDRFPFSVRFPPGSGHNAYGEQLDQGLIPPGASESLPVYAVQLYEAAIDFALCGLLWWFSRRALPRGGGIPLLFTLYGIERFFMEYLRGDHGPGKITATGLTFYQNVSVILVVVFGSLFGIIWYRESRRRGREGTSPAPAAS